MATGRPRRAIHNSRVTAADQDVARRPQRRAVTVTAWIVVGGLTLAVVAPVIALLFG